MKNFEASRLGRKTADITLSNFIGEYLKHIEQTLSKTTAGVYRVMLRTSQEFIGQEKLLKYVSVMDADNFQSHLVRRGIKPSSINQYFITLHSVFKMAVRWDRLSVNPFKKVQRLRVQHTLTFITPEQIQKFHETLSRFWRGMFLFALLTGSRASELVNLRWEDLYFVKRIIQIG